MAKKISELIIAIADNEIGVHENGNSNTGQRVNIYKAATNLNPFESWAWCAAFVDWCVREAMIGCQIKFTFDRPRTAGAWDLIRWSKQQDSSTKTIMNPTEVLAGDIVIYKFSHCGICVSGGSNTFRTIEGNTTKDSASQDEERNGGCVAQKTRNVSEVKAIIRFSC